MTTGDSIHAVLISRNGDFLGMCLRDFLALKPHPDKEQKGMRFEQQVALVTDAASGIGRALVQHFVAEGAAVAAVDIVETPLLASQARRAENKGS